MKRHPFDAVSFFFGLVFTALAAWVLFSGDLDVFEVRWVWPTVLIVGGLAIIGSMFTRRGTAASVESPVADPAIEAAKDELPANPFEGLS